MAKKSLDLTTLLPKQYRDKTLDTLIKNLFNRHVSKADTQPMFGYIGDGDLEVGEIPLDETDLERQLNQITSLIYVEHATEKKTFSWPDLVQKMILLGINYDTIGKWFKSASYNFIPPIDIDKFCNFQEYFWIGAWVQQSPTLDYSVFGIPTITNVQTAFIRSNATYKPEYYTIARGPVDPVTNHPVAPTPALSTWSDWSLTNLWVHKSDIVTFLQQNGGTVQFGQLVQANRPIIEYSVNLKINTYQDALNAPSDSGNYRFVSKIRSNQPPLFDLYRRNGSHSGYASSIFYYTEGSQYAVDPSLERRLAVDDNADFTFEHSLVSGDTEEILFFKEWDGLKFNLGTIWTKGPEDGPKYIKYDNSGTLINHDKFINYKNYYWVTGNQPSYNPTGTPEYAVIEKGGESGWSLYNNWVHVSTLRRSEKAQYIQAIRPIIEFNKTIESELLHDKTSLLELPRFKVYAFDDVTNKYVQLVQFNNPLLKNLNDAYLTGTLFARIDDLGADVKHAIENTPELFNSTISLGEERYLQGFKTGQFVPSRDGAVYGYRAESISFLEPHKGEVGTITTSEDCFPEIIKLTWSQTANQFEVVGSVTGHQPNLTIGVPYSVDGITFTVINGIIPFADGDSMSIQVKSYVFQEENLYVKIGPDFRTFNKPSGVVDEITTDVKIETNPAQRDGAWEVPPQLEWNVKNETRTKIRQGDLYFHLISVIKAQPNLIGSETGSNNFKDLKLAKDVNLGLGGTIKQFDGRASLLISMLLQDGITISSILEFARQNYEGLFSSIHAFIEDVLPQILTDGLVSPPQAGDDIDPRLVDTFKTYFASNTSYKQALVDSTSPIKGLAPTLPYLGLCPKELPRKELDLELNIDMLVHHDGHRSQLAKASVDLLKKIVLKKFPRSSGQETAGIINAVAFPTERPFRGQFWFQASTEQLFVYNVISDVGALPDDSNLGDYSYDRLTGAIYQFNGSWIQLDDYEVTSPWVEIKLDLIEQNLALALETELFEKCPDLTPKLNVDEFMLSTDFTPNMKKELERFGIKYGTPDVYSSAYSASNAFTWNYRDLSPFATWNEIYRDAYGTPRPDLQPWIPAGYADEQVLLDDLISHGLVSTQTQAWTPQMWMQPSISSFLRSAYIANGTQLKLSVDLSTGNLLPPYSPNFESFFSTIPATASDPFYFGAMAPVETFWRKTVNYLYSLQKVYYKINPLEYLRGTWGIKYETIGTYSINTAYGRKESNKDFQLHGESIDTTITINDPLRKLTSNLSCVVQTPPEFSLSYTFKCVSRLDNLFEITINGESQIVGYLTVGTPWSDDTISVIISQKLGHYYWGDEFVINVSSDGIIKTTATSQTTLYVEGLNQLYVQYRRLYGEEMTLSLNQSLLRDWEVKAAYRFGGLINTDSLMLNNQDDRIDASAYQVLVKENKFYESTWLNALKIQLVQKGSTIGGAPRIGPSGTPGEDWVYRVDVFNDARTELSWYKLNTNGASNTFLSLGGHKTAFGWKRFIENDGVLTYHAPFLIRGLQNVINFIFGYSQKMEDEGWRFNDQENPVLDSVTGRPIGYQLLVEQFIDQQFSNVDAGATFVFNPFSRKVWYTTPRGFVSDLFEQIGLEQESVCTILDRNQRPISKSELRIFRQDEITEIIFDKPAYTIHLLTSEYEHVVLFEDYSLDNSLIYDSFLGQRTVKVFVSGDRQTTFTGRLDLGGHFLLGDKMKRNLEDSVSGILDLYSTSSVPSKLPEAEYARALLGFQKKSYFADRGSTDTTEFRFWQGMIANKGTNLSLDAYTNSTQFQTSMLDEYWAYKVADYGDARAIKKAELNIEPEDGIPEHSNYLLIENDELRLLKSYGTNSGFDVANIGITAYDISTLYTDAQSIGYDYVDPRGCIIVRPDDEKRWHKYDDLRTIQYLDASIIAEYRFVPTAANKIYIILGPDGKPVRADCFELVDLQSDGVVYYEAGDYTDSVGYDTIAYDDGGYDTLDPDVIPQNPSFSPPKFVRLNHCTIMFTDISLLGKPLKAIAYGPSFAKYSPSSLIDYRSNVSVKDDIIWWDPARGVHHPEAFKEVDFMADKDPSRYNRSLLTYKNTNIENLRPWGEEQVGSLWWNTNELTWQPYSDAKVITDMSNRLNSWGAISDASTMEVYEWFKSPVPPGDYAKITDVDGEVAIRNVLKRTRDWYQRPVAWRYSENPSAKHTFLAYQPARLRFDLPVLGNETYGTNGRAIISAGDFSSLKIVKGCKIAGGIYGNGGNTKNDVYLTSIYGTAVVTSDPSTVIGSADHFTDGGIFETNVLYIIEAELDERRLSYKKTNVLGQYSFSNEQDGYDFYIRATHVESGDTQRVIIFDAPIHANTMQVYSFDQLGIKLNCTSLFDRADIPLQTEADRLKFCSEIIGNSNHSFWLRSAVDVFINIPFIYNGTWTVQLDSANDASPLGWIAWADPETNPIRDFNPPFNRFEPFAGEWVEMGGQLTNLANDVKLRLGDPWAWFDGTDYTPYKFVWTDWEKYTHSFTTQRYYLITGTNEDFMKSHFTYDIPLELFESRVLVFVNEVQLRQSQWEPRIRFSIDGTPIGVYAYIPESEVSIGDLIKVKVLPATISDDDIKFDPDVLDNIFKNTQFKTDFPHVYEEVRDESDRYTLKNYYFWVKNRASPGKNKRLSTSKVAELLHQHDGVYEVPQIMKQYNQLDGRPNRYSILSVRGLGSYVHQSDQYKLRISNNGTLRNDDRDMSLKNAHVEWILLRPGQPTKIPKTLWDKLTETMVGKSAVNQLLPFSPLQKYDDRNNTNDRYGFGDGQILADPNPTIATVKDTILSHTNTNKYDVLQPEIISYSGFDINQLDTYLATPTSIRKFMADLWRFAKPKQINEIFFAVLMDAAAKNLELTDFFKTSFVAISEIRAVQNGN